MTSNPIKVGDRFTLGKWTWKVQDIYLHPKGAGADWFRAFDENESKSESFRRLDLRLEDAHSLDWLEPEVKKLTKEQAEMIKKEWNGSFEFFSWLDSITEKE